MCFSYPAVLMTEAGGRLAAILPQCASLRDNRQVYSSTLFSPLKCLGDPGRFTVRYQGGHVQPRLCGLRDVDTQISTPTQPRRKDRGLTSDRVPNPKKKGLARGLDIIMPAGDDVPLRKLTTRLLGTKVSICHHFRYDS